MSLTLKGKLTNPMGQPVQNAKIEMRALKTSSVVVATSTAVSVTSDTGEYTITVEQGTYVIRVMFSGGHSWSTLCDRVTVDSTTLATNLNELIITAQVQDPSTDTGGEMQLVLKSLQEIVNKGLAEMRQSLDSMEQIKSNADSALSKATANANTIEALNKDMRTTVDKANTAAEEARTLSKQASDTVAGVNDQLAEIRTIDTRVADTARTIKTQSDSVADSTPKATAAADTATQQATRANLWANAPEDQVVENGEYSAKHWAAKAQKNAASGGSAGTGNFNYIGKWDFADSKFPTGFDTANCFWQVTRNVTVEGTDYVTGDLLYHAVDNGIGRFFRVAAAGGSGGSAGDAPVKSVAGKTGEVVLTAADVGLGKLRNLDTLSKEESTSLFATKEQFDPVRTAVNNAVTHDELAALTGKLNNVAYDGAITSTTGYLAWSRLGDIPPWIRETHTDGNFIYFRSTDGTQFRVGEDTLDMFNTKGVNTFSIGANGQLKAGTVPESLITGVLPISKGGTGSSDGKIEAKKLTLTSQAAGLFFDKVGDYGIYPIHTDDTTDDVEGVVIGATSTSLAITNKGGLSFTGPNDKVIFEVDSTGTVTTGKVPYSVLEGVAPAGIVKRLNDGGIMYTSGNGYMTIAYSNVSVNKATPKYLKFAQPFHDTEYNVQITKKFGTDKPTDAEFAANVAPYALYKDALNIATDSADDIVVCVTITGEKGVAGQDGTTAENSTLAKV